MGGEGRYRLAAVLRLRSEAEHDAAAVLADALAAQARAESELSACEDRFRGCQRDVAAAGRGPQAGSGLALQWRARRLDRLRRDLEELAASREARRAGAEEARRAADRDAAALAAARAERRGIEEHRQRWAEGRREARQAALQAEQDDRARPDAEGRAGLSTSDREP